MKHFYNHYSFFFLYKRDEHHRHVPAIMVISNLVLVLARKICIPSKSLDFNPDKSVSYLFKNSMQYSQLYLMTVRFTPNDKLSKKIYFYRNGDQ